MESSDGGTTREELLAEVMRLRAALHATGEGARRVAATADDRLRACVEHMLDCFGLFSSIRDDAGRIVDFRIDYLNRAACESNRMPLEDQVGRALCDVLPGHRGSELFAAYLRVVESGQAAEWDAVEYADSYGGDRRIDRAFAVRAWKIDDGFAAAWRDVTDRRRAEQAASEGRARFRSIADTAPAMLWVTDDQGRCTFLSAAWCEYTGQSEADGLRLGWTECVHRDDRAEVTRVFLDASARREPFSLEYRLRRADGTYRWAVDLGRPRFDAEGRFAGYVGSVLDIHDRREAERAARDARAVLDAAERAARVSEERLRLAQLAARIGTFEWDIVRDVNEWSPELETLYGLPSGSFEGTYEAWAARLHPEDLPRAEADVRRALETGEFISEWRAVWPDGTVRTLAARAKVIRDDAGRPLRMIGVNLDVTDQRGVQDALRASEEKYRTLFTSMGQGFCILEMLFDEEDRPIDYRLLELNPAFEAQTGVSVAASEGRTVREILPSLEPYWYEIYGGVALTGEPARFAARADVMGRDFDVYAFRVGRPEDRRVAVLFHDVTDRRRAEQALQQSEAQLRRATVAGRVGLWEWHRASNVTTWSDGMWPIYGRAFDPAANPEDIYRDGLHPDDRDRVLTQVERCLHTREEFREEFRVVWPDGQTRWVESIAQALTDAEGRVTGMAGVNIDVTDRRELTERLQDADRRKDEFLATLAHELRNPLAAVGGAVELLARRGDAADVRRSSVAVMQRQVAQLTRLVDDLMDVSRVSRGVVALKREPVDLATVVDAAIEANRSVGDAKGQTLLASVPATAVPVVGDPVRLQQIVGNLVNNACKFTPEAGRVEVSLESADGRAAIRVRDSGVGIPREHLSRVFEPFNQLDPGHTNNTGLGLGLALAHKLTELHGGKVEVHSDGLGRGAVFTVTLPLAEGVTRPGSTHDTAAAHLDDGRGAGRTVLVVDDNRDAADMLALLLESSGFATHAVYDGPSALEAAARLGPDAILLDIGLPGLDGHEVARRLRAPAAASGPGRPLLIALTGWGQDADRERSAAAGFDAHLVKPPDLDTLLGLLDRVE